MNTQELTYGEKAVGVTSNPSGDSTVRGIRALYARIIDECNNHRESASSEEQKRLYSIAIEHAQTAQMWAVKAITWKD